MTNKTIRIGCASGFWGDTEVSTPQLLEKGNIDYLVFDYLAEVTMSIMSRAKARSDKAGYAIDFVSVAMKQNIKTIAEKGIKVIANAGGVNPLACREALLKVAEEAGVDIKVAVVLGDDLMPQEASLRKQNVKEMFSGIEMPEKIMSMNAYLGAKPIVQALEAGAQIIITGRCVDSAVTLAPLMHEFDWKFTDYDLLAAGSLAGHLIECGPQATGGNFTDWDQVEGWEDMGFPIAECSANGDFIITKPEDTGGMVTRGTVGEQMMYEIGDACSYLLPDVSCDFSMATLEEVGKDRVKVSNVLGREPTDTYKVSATYPDGYRVISTLTVGGVNAVVKGERTGHAMISRAENIIKSKGFDGFRETSVEVLGGEATYGPHSRARSAREVVIKIGVRHDNKEALGILAREIAPSALMMSPAISGFYAGRPGVSPVVRLFSFLAKKSDVPLSIAMGGEPQPVPASEVGAPNSDIFKGHRPALESAAPEGDAVNVPLYALAWGRSGDKGNNANIGILARKPEYMPYIRNVLTEACLTDYFALILEGKVERFDFPGSCALNFLLHDILGGGGMASLRIDPQGKAYAQMILDYPIPVPKSLAEKNNLEII